MISRRMLEVIVLGGLAGFGVIDASGQMPQVGEVLNLYRQSHSWMESVSMKVDIEGSATGDLDNRRTSVSFVFNHDKDRVEWRGRSASYGLQGKIDPNTYEPINDVVAGGRYIRFTDSAGAFIPARISRNYEKHVNKLLDNSRYGGPLWGRIHGNNHKSVADLLAESADVHLRDQQENIGNVLCYVLEGANDYGKTTVWIAPDMGYSALKWSIEKTGDDLFDDRSMLGDSTVEVFDSIKLQSINGVFVPIEGVFTQSGSSPDGQKYMTREYYRVSDIQLNPDFGALGAFKVDLPNGTRVQVEEASGVRYIWRDGQIVPDVDGPTFEEIERMVGELKAQK